MTDGVIDPTRYIIVGPPGSVATFGYSVSNYGHFAVRILGSDLSSVEFVHFDLGWTLVTQDPNQSEGSFAAAKPFPMTLHPGQQIDLWVTVAKPTCPKAETTEFYDIGLRTEALGVHHDWQLQLDGATGGQFPPIDACSPAAALKHLTNTP